MHNHESTAQNKAGDLPFFVFFPISNENEGQMKNYATDTMNELLGMFGFDKVDQDETDQLKLGDKFSAKAGRYTVN